LRRQNLRELYETKVQFTVAGANNILVSDLDDELNVIYKASKTYEATNPSTHVPWKIILRGDRYFISWAVNAAAFPDPGATSPVAGDDYDDLRHGTGSQAT
jgi:hypothetical protein